MVRIDGYLIDAAITEEHNLESEVTMNPVEEGSDVTDSIRNKPPSVSMECRVSDSPLAAVASERSEGVLPSDEARAKLLAIRTARQRITVVTSLGTYTDMAITSLGFPRSVKTLGGLWFRVVFQQVEVVANERTTIRTAVPRSKSKVNRGNKASLGGTAPLTTDESVSGYQDTYAGQISDGLGWTNGPSSVALVPGTI